MLNKINLINKLPYSIIFLTLIIFSSCDNTSTGYKTKECNNQCLETGIFCDKDNSSAVFNCTQDKNGCFIKELFQECENNKICVAGTCQIKNCESQCITEGYFCENNNRYQCGNFNDDNCLEKKEAFCENGYNCVMGECKKDCVPSEEVCDGIDNNCNGETDEGVKITFYKDSDNDGFGDINNIIETCSAPDGYVENNNDCNDTEHNTNPDAQEICDGIDNNCNGKIDTEDNTLEDAPLADNQNGICNGSKKICNNEWINPDYTTLNSYELNDESCNSIDNNCNGETDEGYIITNISCGIGECSNTGRLECQNGQEIDTCTPNQPSEEVCDGIDNNCNGEIDEGLKITFYKDSDNDGFGDINNTIEACSLPDGYVENNNDCDDTEHNTNPDAQEICDGTDNNCNSETDENFPDSDNDGIADCVDNCVYTQNVNQLDADDDNMGNACDCYLGNSNIAIQEICNGIDDNCDGQVDEGNVCATDNCVVRFHDNHNYIFCSTNTMKKSWNNARKYCNQKNYNLVTIETEEENNWIRSEISNNHWIGLNDLRDGHKWEAGFGRIWNTDHDDWDEKCWEIRHNDTKWHDRYCSSDVKRRFICEENFNLGAKKTYAKSCKEILDNAINNNQPTPTSGVYYINIGTPGNFNPIPVICDMDTDGGGWTLVASWFYDYNWTLSSYSTSKFFGMATKDTVSSNFGNMVINDFRIIATENLVYRGLERNDDNGNPLGATGADWYYHYDTPIKWKEVWAPQAHNGNNENDCSNGWISSEVETSRQAIKKFNYSKNIKFNYINNNHHWNNIGDWSTIYQGGEDRPNTCDRIADYWGALTQEGIEFTIYNNSNENYDPIEDGTLGIPRENNHTEITGHDISTYYSARVGYDDDNKNACYGNNSLHTATYSDNDENIDNSTKLWWFVR